MKVVLCSLAFSSLLMSCQKEVTSPKLPISRNATIPHLPTASAAKKIQGAEIHLIEVQYSDSGWNVQGEAATNEMDTIEEQIKNSKSMGDRKGLVPTVLIEADGAVAFKNIRAIIRAASKAGIGDFLFAVKQHPMHPDALEHALAFDTYICIDHGCGPPTIAPIILKIDSQGHIWIHTRHIQELINSDPESHEFPKLSNRVEAHRATLRAAAQKPVFQVLPHREAPYQRVIDVINLLRSHGIEREFFIDHINEDIHKPQKTNESDSAVNIPSHVPPAPSVRNPITK